MTEGSKRAIVAALFANLGIAVAKLVGYLITQSAGMLAEAIHSLADTGNQALLLLGGSRARKEATPTHPFGYGRERYFWSFAVSLVLFSVGGLFALYEGIDKFRHPHEVESSGSAVGILCSDRARAFSLRPPSRRYHVRGEESLLAVHPHLEAARAAGRAARGHRRRGRLSPRCRRDAWPRSTGDRAGTPSGRRHRPAADRRSRSC